MSFASVPDSATSTLLEAQPTPPIIFASCICTWNCERQFCFQHTTCVMTEQTNNHDRATFQRVLENSENDFEKKITYISAGALGLSLNLFKMLSVPRHAQYDYLIQTSWIFLSLTLLINLASHLISSSLIRRSSVELSHNYDALLKKIIRRNKLIATINWITLLLMCIGIITLIMFVSANITHKPEFIYYD